MKILCVDDTNFSRKKVTAPLLQAGHDVLEATNGLAGYEMYQLEKPDVIVTDLLMPVLDGLGLIRKIREADQRTPIVVVSADIQASSRQMCEELGICSFVNKPFQPQQILDAIPKDLAGTCSGGV